MQPSIEDVPTLASAERDAAPGGIDLCLPAMPDIGRVVAALIETVVHAWDVEARAGAISDAARAVADELAHRTTPWSALELSVELDDLDVYVRLSAAVAPGDQPELTAATEAVVARAAGSHHLALQGGELLVVLQAALR